MKKYKQVLAAFVAMNLTVYVMPTGIVKISASVESQEDKNTTETALSAESENAAAGESEKYCICRDDRKYRSCNSIRRGYQ